MSPSIKKSMPLWIILQIMVIVVLIIVLNSTTDSEELEAELEEANNIVSLRKNATITEI